jgi:hypothetical protein
MSETFKDIIKEKIRGWDGDKYFGFLGWIAVLLGMVTLFYFVNAQKEIRCYYLHSEGLVYRIYADIDWSLDYSAFITTDYKILMEVYNQLPQCGGE